MKKHLLTTLFVSVYFICSSQVMEDGKLSNGKDLKEALVDTNQWQSQESIKIGSELITQIPVFKGCNKKLNLIQQKKCLNKSISMFFAKKFKTKKTSGLPAGTYKIYSSFRISKKGEIIDLVSFSKYKFLEEEANRILLKVPKLIPGKVGNEPVNIKYLLPVNFKID